MRGVVYHRYGEPADVLGVEEVEVPTPGEGELLIRVTATPLLHGSVLAVRGRYRSPRDDSKTPPAGGRQGYEGAGVIAAVGPGVAPGHALKPGSRVAFFPGLGAWGEMVVVPAGFVVPVPADLPDRIAAQLHINPLTAVMLVNAAVEAGAASEGDRAIVVDAGASSVGKLVTAIARSSQYSGHQRGQTARGGRSAHHAFSRHNRYRE